MIMVKRPIVIEAFELVGLKSEVKVMIGGTPVTCEFADNLHTEGFAEDCA